ncbi:MAG: nucleotidyltransferase domain-containing protein [Vicinamibacterales bacterium]
MVPESGQPLNHRVEVELLLRCARMEVDSECQPRIRSLVQQKPDWDILIVTAHQHRVVPLLCRTLERVAPDAVPDATLRRLRSAVHANAKRNLCLTSELLRALGLLRVHGIPCLPYKGPVLAARVYGDLSLRQFADLDIIVPAQDVARATTLLLSHGYGSGTKMSTEKDIALRHDDLGFDLEVHWGVTTEKDPIQVPDQLLWRDLSTFSIAGTSVLSHSSEALLLLQCVHGAKHGWDRLVWLCDVAEIVRSQPNLNWNRAMEQATALGARRILLLGVTLARELLGAEPPADVTRAIRDEAALTTLANQVKEWLFSGRTISPGEREPFFIRLRERPADKLRITFKQAKSNLTLNSRDTESFPVPGFLIWMLYPLRVVRLVREYGAAPFVRFLGGIFHWQTTKRPSNSTESV